MRHLNDTHAQQLQSILPLARLECLGKDVGCLEVGLDVLDLNGIGVNDLLDGR